MVVDRFSWSTMEFVGIQWSAKEIRKSMELNGSHKWSFIQLNEVRWSSVEFNAAQWITTDFSIVQ